MVEQLVWHPSAIAIDGMKVEINGRIGSEPETSSCIIRAMPTTDSDGCRPPVPSDAVQSFRRMASDFSGTPESVVAMIWNQWTACSGIRKGKRTP
jgi:hypothetical protein